MNHPATIPLARSRNAINAHLWGRTAPFRPSMWIKSYVPKQPTTIYITDHALVRHMERVMGADFEPIREGLRELVKPAVVAGARSLRQGGMEYVLDGHKLITVQPRTKRKGK